MGMHGLNSLCLNSPCPLLPLHLTQFNEKWPHHCGLSRSKRVPECFASYQELTPTYTSCAPACSMPPGHTVWASL